jgi:hypothetical protein
MSNEKKPDHSKTVKIVLFWSNWFLVLFLGRKLFGSPGDNVDFLLKNLGTFAVAIISTVVILHYLQGRVIKITMVAIWIVTLFIAAIRIW